METATAPEVPAQGEPTESLGALLSSIMPADPAGETPPPASPPAADPAAPPVEPPVPAEPASKSGKAFAEMRVAAKTAEAEKARIAAEKENLAAEKARLAEELEAFRTRAAELEASVSERDAKLKETETYYREKEVIPQVDVMKLPEVAESASRVTDAARRLLTAETADLNAGESSLRVYMDRLSPVDRNRLMEQITAWDKMDQGNYTDQQRRAYQHVALSNMAAVMKADSSHFEEVQIDGKPFRVISTQHPLYRHLATNIGDAAEAIRQFQATHAKASENIFETGRKIIGGRVGKSKELYAGSLALSGDALKQKLSASPDDPILTALSVIDSDPALKTALNEAIEHEARVNGHTTNRIEPVEADPQKRTAFAQAIQARLDARVRNAPLMAVLPSVVAKQQKEIATMRAELEALRAEKQKFEAAGEPGGGALPSNPAAGLSNVSEWEKIAMKAGLIGTAA
jgi:hypothetical protein